MAGVGGSDQSENDSFQSQIQCASSSGLARRTSAEASGAWEGLKQKNV